MIFYLLKNNFSKSCQLGFYNVASLRLVLPTLFKLHFVFKIMTSNSRYLKYSQTFCSYFFITRTGFEVCCHLRPSELLHLMRFLCLCSLALNTFGILFWCFYCRLRAGKFQLERVKWRLISLHTIFKCLFGVDGENAGTVCDICPPGHGNLDWACIRHLESPLYVSTVQCKNYL